MIKKIVKKMIKKGLISYRWFERPFWIKRGDEEKIKQFKNKYQGNRCFIIGNGPSLNKIDLLLLADEYTFGVNSIFIKTENEDFKPTFYVVEDRHVMSDNVKKINAYDVNPKFIPTNYRRQIYNKDGVIFYNMNEGFAQEYSPNFEKPRFSEDPSKEMFCGQSVTIMNLQLAYYMGFTEVYLIGMDFSYDIPDSAIIDNNGTITSTEDDPNHFDGSYFGKGKKWHDPKLYNVLKSYIKCKEVYEKDNRKIFNATVGGKLEVFERIDFKKLFS